MEKKLRFNCRKCKTVQTHTVSDEGGMLPPNTYLAQCCRCEVMGIQLIDAKEVENADL